MDSALGEGGYDDQEIDALKESLREDENVIVTDFASTPGGSEMSGILGGVITKEDDTHIYITGKNRAYKEKEKNWKVTKNVEKKNWKGDVVETRKSIILK